MNAVPLWASALPDCRNKVTSVLWTRSATLELQQIRGRFARHGRSDPPTDGFIRGLYRIMVEMGIARRRLRLRMPQKLADHRQSHARPGANAGERMTQVM